MFEFTQANKLKAEAEIAKYPHGQEKSAIMALLWIAQEQEGGNYLSKEKLEYVAAFLDLPIMRVYEVASFYTMFNMSDPGKYQIQICGTVPCHIMGSRDIMRVCKSILGVDEKNVTSDGKFSFTTVECLGACASAPVVQINNKEYYEKVDIEKMKTIIKDLMQQ